MNSCQLHYFSGFQPLAATDIAMLWQDGLPFYFQRQSGAKAVVICVHGFLATPYEVRPIGAACDRLGIDAIAPLLPGHGYAQTARQKREVLKIRLESMLDALRQEVRRARAQYEFVGICGQSMGGALSLVIASENLVDAVAVTAPALKLPIWAELLTLLLGWWKPLNLNWNPVRQPFYNLGYRFSNANASTELLRTAAYARQVLSNVSCPVYVAHSHGDRLIAPVVCDWIQAQVRHEVTIQWFDRSDHTMPLDVQGEEVSTAIATFFRNQFALLALQQASK